MLYKENWMVLDNDLNLIMFDKSVVINRLVLRFFHFTVYTIQKEHFTKHVYLIKVTFYYHYQAI